jgi:phosphotriesterase-related protein
MTRSQAGTIRTVLGPIEPSEVGPALMHEHVFSDLTATFAPVDDPSLIPYREAPVSEDLYVLLHIWPFSLTLDNVRLDDELLAAAELGAFADAGGRLLVDCTVEGIGRNPAGLRRIARTTGLQIVQGTGFYVELAHPPRVSGLTVDQLAAEFVRDLRDGIGDSGVRAGIIGEIGTSGIDPVTREKHGDMTLAEEKVLRAAAIASGETGAAVAVHLDPRGTGAYRAVEILAEAGAPPDRMIMCHMDAHPELEYHLRVAETGVFIEYDHFGREYYAGHLGRPYVQDARRLDLLCALLERGFIDQLLLSQDVCAKIDLHRHGGNGYDHILRRIVPQLRARGVTDAAIDAMLVQNPRRALAF